MDFVFLILFYLAGQRAVWPAAASALAPVEGINIAFGASEDFYLRLRRDERKEPNEMFYTLFGRRPLSFDIHLPALLLIDVRIIRSASVFIKTVDTR